MTAFPLPQFTPWNVIDRRGSGDAMLARMAVEAPRVPWDKFLATHFDWNEGEHVGLIGPTGQGKTTLLISILKEHPYVVVFATKPKDDSMERLIASGYLRMDHWATIPAERAPRRVLWPSAMEMDSDETQRAVFENAFARIYREGGWTVVLDEGYYIVNELGLRRPVMKYLSQARALGISLVLATQRPAWVPTEVYDQSTHLFFWRDNDETNLRRISGISWRSADLIRTLVANLNQYQVLYINTRTGAMVRTTAPAPRPTSPEGR